MEVENYNNGYTRNNNDMIAKQRSYKIKNNPSFKKAENYD